MERHCNILGWLWIAYSALFAIGATAGIVIFLFVVDDGEKTAGELLFLAVGSLPGVIGGIWLLKRRSWARILILIFATLNLMAIPIGTALGVYTFWILLRREAPEFFN